MINILQRSKCVGMCTDVQKGQTLSKPDNIGGLKTWFSKKSSRAVWTYCINQRQALCLHTFVTSTTESSVIWRHGCRNNLLKVCCSSEQFTQENVATFLCRSHCAFINRYLTKANHGSTMILKLTCTSMAVKVANFLELNVTLKSLLRNLNRVGRTWKMTLLTYFRINSIFNRKGDKNYEIRQSVLIL